VAGWPRLPWTIAITRTTLMIHRCSKTLVTRGSRMVDLSACMIAITGALRLGRLRRPPLARLRQGPTRSATP
jgi:hypothetical protein